MQWSKKEVGDLGEQYARRYLEDRGFTIIDTNARVPHGELDIVAQKRGSTHLIEVKTRLGSPRTRYTQPVENITKHKIKKLVYAATIYTKSKKLSNWQIDVVLVWISRKDKKTFVSYIPKIGA